MLTCCRTQQVQRMFLSLRLQFRVKTILRNIKVKRLFFPTGNILTCHKRKNTRVNRKWMTAEFHLAALVSGSWHWACLARCHDFLGIEQSYRSHYCNTCTFPTMTSQNVWAVEKRLSSQCKKLCSLGHFYSHMSLSMHLLMQIWKKNISRERAVIFTVWDFKKAS